MLLSSLFVREEYQPRLYVGALFIVLGLVLNLLKKETKPTLGQGDRARTP